MSDYVDRDAYEDLDQATRVKLRSDGTVDKADTNDGDVTLGTTSSSALAGDRVRVLIQHAAGTMTFVATGAINVGDRVYTAASGKVKRSAGGSATYLGIALQSAGADGDRLEVALIG